MQDLQPIRRRGCSGKIEECCRATHFIGNRKSGWGASNCWNEGADLWRRVTCAVDDASEIHIGRTINAKRHGRVRAFQANKGINSAAYGPKCDLLRFSTLIV